jgi:hypothetical protein
VSIPFSLNIDTAQIVKFRWADRLFVVICIVGFAVIALAFAFAQHGAFPDDIYITWRCARNFAEGYGLSYNHGENYLGTSGPGYALLIGMLGKVIGFASIPIISEVLSTTAIFLTAVGLLFSFIKSGHKLLGAAAGTLYISSPFVRSAYGFEVLLQIACVVWALFLYFYPGRITQARWICLALLATGAFFRPDGMLWIVPIAFHAWFQNYNAKQHKSVRTLAFIRAFPLREALFFCFVLGLGLLAIRATSGQWIPTTYAAKSAQRSSTDWPGFLKGGVNWLETVLVAQNRMLPAVMWLSIGGLACSSYAIAVQKIRPLGVLLVAAFLHFAIYSEKLPFYSWYYAIEGLMFAVLAGLAINSAYRLANRLLPYAGTLVVAVGVYCGYLFVTSSLSSSKADQVGLATSEKVRTYFAFGEWLKLNTQPNESVGLCEVGIIGWVSDRPIIDQFFLVSRGDLESIGRHVYDKSFRDRKPTYIAESPSLFGTMRGHTWFWRDYEFVTSFPSGHAKPMTPDEADLIRPSGKLELDVWRRRKEPIPSDQAEKLSSAYNHEADLHLRAKQ